MAHKCGTCNDIELYLNSKAISKIFAYHHLVHTISASGLRKVKSSKLSKAFYCHLINYLAVHYNREEFFFFYNNSAIGSGVIKLKIGPKWVISFLFQSYLLTKIEKFTQITYENLNICPFLTHFYLISIYTYFAQKFTDPPKVHVTLHICSHYSFFFPISLQSSINMFIGEEPKQEKVSVKSPSIIQQRITSN